MSCDGESCDAGWIVKIVQVTPGDRTIWKVWRTNLRRVISSFVGKGMIEEFSQDSMAMSTIDKGYELRIDDPVVSNKSQISRPYKDKSYSPFILLPRPIFTNRQEEHCEICKMLRLPYVLVLFVSIRQVLPAVCNMA